MSHPVNQLFYVLGVLFLFLILMEAINLIAIQPRSRKTVATVTKIRLRSAEDSRHAGPFSGKQKRKKNMAYVTYSVDGRSYFSQREIPVSADKDIGSQVTVWYAVLFSGYPDRSPFLCKARPLYPAVPADVSCRFLTVAVN